MLLSLACRFFVYNISFPVLTRAVPSAPAPFLLNFWGTNSSSWGGTATTGITRYMYISNFRYTP